MSGRLEKTPPRVRFAPSPTGLLHLGGARTALINYLFAKNQNGAFILRVEDTDEARGSEAFLKEQLNDLKWLGLDWDEGPKEYTGLKGQENQGPYGPYRQSQRLLLYQKYARQLIQEKKAYYCFLRDEEIQRIKKKAIQNKQPPRVKSPYRDQDPKQAELRIAKGEKAVIRFKTSESKKNYLLQDIVRGEVSFPSDMVGDFVLLRSSGLPVYNFACAVDDYSMKISHVFRSEEHLANTLRQLMIFSAFNWPAPLYGHLSLILGEDRKKLSKRHGALSCSEYKKQGYLPSALLNFLALMGWNPKTEREIFSREELVDAFSLKGLNPSPGVFDVKKLSWMNSRHLRQVPDLKLWDMLQPFFEDLKFPEEESWRIKAVQALKDSCTTLRSAVELFRLLSENYCFKPGGKAKETLNLPLTGAVLKEWKLFLESRAEESISPELFSKTCRDIQQKTKAKGKFLFMPVRVAVLGSPQGMELKTVVPLISRKVLLKRVLSISQFLPGF